MVQVALRPLFGFTSAAKQVNKAAHQLQWDAQDSVVQDAIGAGWVQPCTPAEQWGPWAFPPALFEEGYGIMPPPTATAAAAAAGAWAPGGLITPLAFPAGKTVDEAARTQALFPVGDAVMCVPLAAPAGQPCVSTMQVNVCSNMILAGSSLVALMWGMHDIMHGRAARGP